jgi:hypothetical protein
MGFWASGLEWFLLSHLLLLGILTGNGNGKTWALGYSDTNITSLDFILSEGKSLSQQMTFIPHERDVVSGSQGESTIAFPQVERPIPACPCSAVLYRAGSTPLN